MEIIRNKHLRSPSYYTGLSGDSGDRLGYVSCQAVPFFPFLVLMSVVHIISEFLPGWRVELENLSYNLTFSPIGN